MNSIPNNVRQILGIALVAASSAVIAEQPSGEGAEPASVDFSRQIQPILSSACFACHGPDENKREADLRLDVRGDAVAGRGGTPAIVPGNSSESELYRRIVAEDPDLRMPPADSGHSLKAEQVALIRKWIDDGAEYTRHWSFVKPSKPPLPKVEAATWPRNAIDRFVLARLEQAGLSPNTEADRYTLLRRLSLDLTGLPPTPEQADRFVNDKSDDAYEKVVDRLLESDRFGEHWARMWLDLARYADTKGYEKDQPRKIWRYRDWVIDALNADMPYDQFTIQQLAGDLLPDPTSDQLLATAFHRNTMTNDEGGTDNEEFRIAAVKDRVDSTIQIWMGLTMGCAKCHSHKYDPITQREYYRFFAFFNQTQDADRSDDAPRAATPTREQQAKLRAFVAQLEQAQATQQEDAPNAKSEIEKLEKEIANLKKQFPQTPVMRELAQNKRRKTHVHVRGNFLQKGDEVQPGTPAAFGPLPDGAPASRLGVARWLVSPENPLTARVAVNRVWARIFGIGIVETEEDFGTQGLPPSHPELLDWLAVDFRDSLGWSLKQLCKKIVMSATYRQSSRIDPQAAEADPQNRLLGRASRFRLPAETVRDQALAAAGLLSSKIGGPSVMPPQPPGIWRTTYSKLKWQTSKGEDRYRRALYTFWRRTSPYPAMLTFDAGSREVCVIRRVRTNTPLQALVTMNDPVYIEAAAALARRMMDESGPDARSRVVRGFRLLLTRPPNKQEVDRLLRLYEETAADFDNDPHGTAAALLSEANVKETPADEAVELAAWTIVANVLLNLDETLMRN